jgi:hypothetical protein
MLRVMPFLLTVFSLGQVSAASITGEQLSLGFATLLAFLVILLCSLWAIAKWKKPPTE